MFELDNVKNAAILRDFVNVWTWRRQKRSNSARLPQFLNLTTSKTQQFCETSSMFELDNVKNEAILRDFLNVWTWQRQKRSNLARLLHFSKLTTSKRQQFCETSFKNGKLRAAVTASYQCILRFFQSKLLRLPRKSDARSYEVLHLSRKIILANLKIGGSKMQPLSGNQRPDLLTALMNMSLVLRLPQKMHLGRSCSNVPRMPLFLDMPQNPHVLLTFEKVHNPLRLPRETTSERPKVVRTEHVVFLTFWLRNVLRARAVCTCSTSQLPKVVWTCGVFFTFWLRNVLRATTACTFSTSELQKAVRSWGALYILTSKCFATTACTFSTSQLPKVVRQWCALYILTSKCASRHNGVQIFISHLASWLRTRRFGEPTFRPSGATNHWKILEKHSVWRLSYLFAHLHLLSSDSFSFSSLIFSLLLFSSLWLFPSLPFICPYCRKFDF